MTHSADDSDHNFFFSSKFGFDFIEQLYFFNFEIFFGGSVFQHQNDKIVRGDVDDLKLFSVNVWHVHVMGGRAHIFVFLISENIITDHHSLGVTVLSSFRSGNRLDLNQNKVPCRGDL